MKYLATCTIILALFLVTSCKLHKPKQEFYISQNAMSKPAYLETSDSIWLNIPNLNWDKYTAGVERVGWCGEASIQMIALYYGFYHSQKVINRTGNPKHLDLYSDEIDGVMRKLGFKYSRYINETTENLANYHQWVKENLKQHRPIFSGVKRNPTGNPGWSLDHFVVMVGYGSDYINYNSNNHLYGQVKVEESLFMHSSKPYTLKNPFNSYFGFSVNSVELPNVNKTNTKPARLFVLGETEEKVDIGIQAEKLIVGSEYSIIRKTLNINSNQHVEEVLKTFIATENTMIFSDMNLPKHESYYYGLRLNFS